VLAIVLVIFVVLLVFLEVDGTPRARFNCSHSLMVCLVSRWNWN
jgi:hypothetical protein